MDKEVPKRAEDGTLPEADAKKQYVRPELVKKQKLPLVTGATIS